MAWAAGYAHANWLDVMLINLFSNDSQISVHHRRLDRQIAIDILHFYRRYQIVCVVCSSGGTAYRLSLSFAAFQVFYYPPMLWEIRVWTDEVQ